MSWTLLKPRCGAATMTFGASPSNAIGVKSATAS
jgi:hypothetical protein